MIQKVLTGFIWNKIMKSKNGGIVSYFIRIVLIIRWVFNLFCCLFPDENKI